MNVIFFDSKKKILKIDSKIISENNKKLNFKHF